jgi:acetyltransferase-like isoleucine patch superfamily enzyme
MERRLGLYLKSALCTVWFRMHGFQSSLVACDGMLPTLIRGGTVRVGKRVIVRSRVARCEIGAEKGAVLEIGDGTFINQGATVAARSHITIGRNTQIGDFAAVYDTNYHRIDPEHPVKCAPVVIGENVWIGRGVLVLPGSNVGDHTVVAAGSVVSGDLPPRVLAAGNPAKPVKELQIPDGWRRR